MKKFKLILWIVAFLFILLSIPIFLIDGNVGMARLFGGIFAALAVIAIVMWRGQNLRTRSKKKRVQLSEENRNWMKGHIEFYAQLSRKDAVIFEDRIRLFMANISIQWENKNAEMTEKILVASSAIMAFWGLPYFNYGGVENVIIASEGTKVEWSPHQVKINYSLLKKQLEQKGEEKNSNFPNYTDFLSHNTNADFSSFHFHQELWAIIVEKLISQSNRGNDSFFKAIEKFQKDSPAALKEMNPSLDNLFTAIPA